MRPIVEPLVKVELVSWYGERLDSRSDAEKQRGLNGYPVTIEVVPFLTPVDLHFSALSSHESNSASVNFPGFAA